MVSIFDDFVAKFGSTKQKISALERLIKEQQAYIELYDKMKKNAENRKLNYESKIEDLKWQARK